MRTVDQPSHVPTRKLSAAMLSASAAGIAQATVVHAYPQYADPVIWEPLPYLIGGVVGYFVKDSPNVPTARR